MKRVTCSKTPPPPLSPPSFSPRDLRDGIAPEGVYKRTDLSSTARVVVLHAGAGAVAILVQPSFVEPLFAYPAHAVFERMDDEEFVCEIRMRNEF